MNRILVVRLETIAFKSEQKKGGTRKIHDDARRVARIKFNQIPTL